MEAPPAESRHCEERSDEAIHLSVMPHYGLLPPSLFELRRTSRCARNDVEGTEVYPAATFCAGATFTASLP
jgi:hypothetical protein